MFSEGLREALHDPDMLKEFLRSRLAELRKRYERYCVNKPKSEFVVNQYDRYFRKLQLKLQMDMGLSDLLIKPVQNLTRSSCPLLTATSRYHMFFEDLARLSTRAGQLKEAELYSECAEMARCSPSLLTPLAREVSRSANNMMAAGRIEADGFYIEKQGALLKRGDARCKEMKSSSRQVGLGTKLSRSQESVGVCGGAHDQHAQKRAQDQMGGGAYLPLQTVCYCL